MQHKWTTTDRWKPKNGSGFAVLCGDQLGYAKFGHKCNEVIASCLGLALKLPVPRIELGTVEGSDCTISYVRNVEVLPVGNVPHIAPALTDEQNQAVAKSDELIPFLIWIEASDHTSYTNYVFEKENGSISRVIAVDFEDSLCFA